MGKYDAILDEEAQGQATAPGAGKYDNVLDNELQQNQQRTRFVFEKALAINPDQAAQAQRLAARTGLPADTVSRNLDDVMRKDQARMLDLARLAQDSPVLARQLLDPTFTNQAHDDVQNLGTLERIGRQLFGSAGENVGRELHGFGELANVAQRRAIAVAASMLLPEPTPGPMGLKAQQPTPESLVGPQIGDGWSSLGKETMDYYRRNVMLPGDQQTFGDQVVGGLGQVASQIMMLPFDRGLGLYAQGASVMSERVANDQASQFNKDLAIVGGAAVTGITEKWALDKLLGPLAVPVRNKVAATLARIGIGAAAEGGQEFSENVLDDLIHKALINPNTQVDLGQAGDQAAVGGAVGGIIRSIVEAGLHVKARGDHKLRQAQTAEDNAQAIDALAKLSQDSKLRQRAPEVFQQFVQEATQGGPLENVFISAQTLAQSAKIEQIKAISPAVAEQLDQALQTGGDVQIPVAEFASQIAGPGYAADIINELKTEPGGMTRTEAQAYTQDQTASMDVEIQALAAEQSPDLTRQDQVQAIQQQITAQLNQAGRFSPAVNHAYAQLPAAFFDTMAHRLGGMPAQLFQEYAPNIVAEGLTGHPMLSQDARGGIVPTEQASNLATDSEAFRTWFDGSKVVDAAGKPMVVYHGSPDARFVNEDGIFATLKDRMLKYGNTPESKIDAEQGRAFFFTTSKAVAKSYADDTRAFDYQNAEAGVIPTHVSITNPLEFDAGGAHWREAQKQISKEDFIKKAKKDGHDGVIIRNVRDSYDSMTGGNDPLSDVVVAFTSTQIKHAEKNNGNYDPTDPNILHQGDRGGFVPAEFTQGGKAMIGLFKGADLSSFLHESGHYFLETFSHMAKTAPALQADMDALVQWMGVQDTATWHAMTLEDKRQHHEQFARGFEQYLADGQAPSLQMQGLFSRFRDWLVSVYRNLKGLNVELSPEVRAVMDRMLATDAHIAEAQQARGMAPLFTTPEEAAAHGVAWHEYQQLGADATAEAVSQLEARSMRDMTWTARLREKTINRINKDAKGKRDAVMGEVAAEVMLDPVYQVQRWLKKGVLPDGSQTVGAKLSTTALAEMYGDGPATPRRYLATNLVAADGLHPDVVAEMFGFKSGDAMVRAIVDALPFRAQVDAITDQRMLQEYGDMHSPDAVARAADQAIHNEVRTRFIATELTGLQKAVGGARVAAKMAKDYAIKMLTESKVGQIRPTQYAAAEVRAGKAAGVAMRKGDTPETIKQKRFQLINHTATQEAYKVQDEVTKTLAFFKTVSTGNGDSLGKTHNMDIINAGRAILAEYGVGMRGKNPRQYMEAVKAYDPELYLVMEPMLLDAENNAKDLKSLTVGELRALRDNVESLWYLAKRERQVEIDGQLVDRDTVKEALGQRLDTLGIPDTVPGEGHAVTESEKTVRYLMGVRAALRRVESWVGRMDSGKVDGAFRKYLFTPISEAADRYRADAGTYLGKYRDLLKAIEPTLTAGRIDAPELGYTFGFSKGSAGKAELLHAILHTGNESNKRKLLLGRGWATEIVEGVLDTNKWDGFISRMIREGKLTKADFDFAQGVWELMEEIKPLAQKTHRQVFGRYFDEITAEGFTNQFGSYAGGYVPAITDTFEVQDSAVRAELEAVNQGNAFMFPSTSRGFTKGRVEYNKPLALDLRLLPQHIDKALLFANMEPSVRDVTRTLRDKAVATKLGRYDPVAYSDLLLPWLNRAAKQTVETPATGWGGKLADKFFRTARSRAGMAAMFANVTNAMQQITGLSITAIQVKPSHLKSATWRYMRSPKELAAQVAELSPMMATRMDNQAMLMRQEIDELLLNPNKYEQAKAFTAKHAYFLQSAAQNVVDVITWSAAFDQGTTEGMAHAEAVRHANAVVRETQGSLSPEDISRFESGPAFTRMFTQFASYFNMQANLLGSEFAKVAQEMGLKAGAGRMLYVFALGLLIPAWFAEAIVQAMHGGPDDNEGDGYLDEFLAFFFGAPARNLLAMVPVAGQSSMLVVNSFNNKPYDDRMSTAPAVSMIESAAKAPHSVYMAIVEDGKASRAIKDTLTLVAMATGMPVTALGKPLGYAADWGQGRIDPTGPVDAARGLVTGTASAESKQ